MVVPADTPISTTSLIESRYASTASSDKRPSSFCSFLTEVDCRSLLEVRGMSRVVSVVTFAKKNRIESVYENNIIDKIRSAIE